MIPIKINGILTEISDLSLFYNRGIIAVKEKIFNPDELIQLGYKPVTNIKSNELEILNPVARLYFKNFVLELKLLTLPIENEFDYGFYNLPRDYDIFYYIDRSNHLRVLDYEECEKQELSNNNLSPTLYLNKIFITDRDTCNGIKNTYNENFIKIPVLCRLILSDHKIKGKLIVNDLPCLKYIKDNSIINIHIENLIHKSTCENFLRPVYKDMLKTMIK